MVNFGFQRTKSSPVVSKTLEEVMDVCRSEALRQTFAQIDEAILAGDDDRVTALKGKLPCVVWNRSYDKGSKRKKNTGYPTGVVMMDWDDSKSEEELQAFIGNVKEAVLTNDFVSQHLLAAHISPRRHGIHALWAWVDGCKSIEEVQERVVKETGWEGYDESCKDNSRISFLVSIDRFFYMNDRFADTSDLATLQSSQEVLTDARRKSGKKVEEKRTEVAATPSDVQFPTDYNGISYADIIKEVVKKVCKKSQLSEDGTPSQGNRHLTWLKCCSHLRTICDNNPQWLYQMAPQWAFDSPGNDVMQTCVDACAEKTPYGISKALQGILSDLDKEQFERDEKGNMTTESWLETFHKNHKAPVLPPILKDILSGLPEPYYEAALAHLICMFASICFSKARARYLDGRIKSPNLQVIIEAPSQSGKGTFKNLYDDLFARVKASDEAKLTLENEWKQKSDQKRGVKELDDRPRFVTQTAGINISATKLMDVALDNHDVHLYVFEEEILTAKRELRKSYGIQYDHIRKAFDNGEVYQNNKSAQSSTGRYKVFLNYTFTGTVEDTEKFIKGEIEGGTANRIMWCVIPEQRREGYMLRLPDEEKLEEIRDKIDEWIHDYVYYVDEDGNDVVRDEILLDLDYLLSPLNDWNLMQWDYAEVQKNHARKSVRYRYAQMGFIAGMVAHLMWGCPTPKDKKTRQHVIDLARYFATMGIERFLHKHADEQNEIHKLSRKKEVKKDYLSVLDYLPQTFTKEQLQDAMQNIGYKSPLRSVVCRFKSYHIIEELKDKKKFRKLI